MELFNSAKTVKLESHHGKYLVANDDKENVQQSRDGSSRNARWEVEFVKGNSDVVRLKSFHGLYLTASPESPLLSITSKKVIQTDTPTPAVEWKPIMHGSAMKLETAEGQFLRANSSSPPWLSSVTHDVPVRGKTQDWVLWKVEVVDELATPQSAPAKQASTPASAPAKQASTPASTPAKQASTPASTIAKQRENATTNVLSNVINRQQGQSYAGGANIFSDSASGKGYSEGVSAPNNFKLFEDGNNNNRDKDKEGVSAPNNFKLFEDGNNKDKEGVSAPINYEDDNNKDKEDDEEEEY